MIPTGTCRDSEMNRGAERMPHDGQETNGGGKGGNEGQCLKLAQHTLSDAGISCCQMTVAHMVLAFCAVIVRARRLCMDMKGGEKQHWHENCQKYP